MSSRMISFTLWTEHVNAYAEDDQIYESDKDPLTLERHVNAIFSKWYDNKPKQISGNSVSKYQSRF